MQEQQGVRAFSYLEVLRPLTLIVGPFGSGKTEISLNLALGAAAAGAKVTLVDLDTVTPALRSRQAVSTLRGAGVELVAPAGRLAYADLPAVPGGVQAAMAAADRFVIVDVGGNPNGARVLASLSASILGRPHHCWAVVSPWRPDASEPAAARRMLTAIATQGRIDLTGIVGNLHLPGHVAPERIRHGWQVVAGTATAMGLPVAMCAARTEDAPLIRQVLMVSGVGTGALPLLELRLMMRPPWETGPDDAAWHWQAELPVAARG